MKLFQEEDNLDVVSKLKFLKNIKGLENEEEIKYDLYSQLEGKDKKTINNYILKSL